MGNRTRYTETITSTNIITYAYDAANRLTNVDGVAYTWDDNGNLLSDGSKTYTYTQANRLVAVSDQQPSSGQPSAISFVYNGDGARRTQTVDGVVTTYTIDLAAPLVTVLAERTGTTTTHYVYALGTRLLAQYEGEWAYLLPDALGSVRQLADADGNVTLAQAYQPYGSLLERAGSGTSTFGYAGEQADTSGLIYLRARYYDPVTGRFTQRDPFPGLSGWPQSENFYPYATNNPILHTDASGKFPWWLLLLLLLAGGCTAKDDCPLNAEINLHTGLAERQSQLEKIQILVPIDLPMGYKFVYSDFSGPRWVNPNSPSSNIPYSYGYTPWLDHDRSGEIIIYEEAFRDFGEDACDVAAIMVHEAVHAWQGYSVSQLAEENAEFRKANTFPNLSYRSMDWAEKYGARFIEAQANDFVLGFRQNLHFSDKLEGKFTYWRDFFNNKAQPPIPGLGEATEIQLQGFPLQLPLLIP